MKISTVGTASVQKIIPPKITSHKGDNGRVLIFAGSKNHFGALVFAGIAASRYADWVYVATTKTNVPIAKRLRPTFTPTDFSTGLSLIQKTDAILVGPGLETSPITKRLLQRILDHPEKPTILDATALRLLSPTNLHARCVITPHADEFQTFFGQPPAPRHLNALAKLFGGIIVLKGPIDYIATPSSIHQNKTGNPGMSKGGTGDILAGLITAFCAKNDALDSCLAATYLNGFAGDELFQTHGTMFDAVDLLDQIPRSFQKLSRSNPVAKP